MSIEPVLAADRHRRLRSHVGERVEARAASAAEDERQHVVHRQSNGLVIDVTRRYASMRISCAGRWPVVGSSLGVAGAADGCSATRLPAVPGRSPGAGRFLCLSRCRHAFDVRCVHAVAVRSRVPASLGAPPRCAQFDTATVVGTVRDASRRRRARRESDADAVPAPASPSSRRRATTATTSSRRCGPGGYVVTAEKDRLRDGAGGQRAGAGRRAAARRPRRWRSAQVTEKVQVTASSPLVETDSSQRGQVISGDQTRALPLMSREYSSLALLTTGVKLGGIVADHRQHAARRGVQRQRPAQRVQQLPDRRRGQQRLRHQQPGLLEPGDAADAGCDRRVQGRHQQHERGVRPRRRRDDQRQLPQRHQRAPRQRAGSSCATTR